MDGLKVDEHGNLWASGPGGVFVMNADGCLVGTIHLQEIANTQVGDVDVYKLSSIQPGSYELSRPS